MPGKADNMPEIRTFEGDASLGQKGIDCMGIGIYFHRPFFLKSSMAAHFTRTTISGFEIDNYMLRVAARRVGARGHDVWGGGVSHGFSGSDELRLPYNTRRAKSIATYRAMYRAKMFGIVRQTFEHF